MIVLSINRKGAPYLNVLSQKASQINNDKINKECSLRTHSCIQRLNINDEAVKWMKSEASFQGSGLSKKDFKRLSRTKRVEQHLQIIAEGNPFEYEEIKE